MHGHPEDCLLIMVHNFNDSMRDGLLSMASKHVFSIVGLVSILALTSGCTGLGLAVGAGAKTGIEAAKEGGLSRAVSDFGIQAKINDLWFQRDLDIFRKLDLTVNQGRVLITGVVQDSHHRVEAVRLAWQPKGVKQVINEIKVAESSGISGYARDLWVSTQLKTKLTLDKEIQSINYTIDTVQGSVYLMGVAANQNELNRVIDQARTVSGVKEVVSYVKFAGQPLTQDTLNSAPPAHQDYQGYASPNGQVGQPVGGTFDQSSSRYNNVSPYSNSSSVSGQNRAVQGVTHPVGPSPMAQPEQYVPRGDLPPPGQWDSNAQVPASSYKPSPALKESVQVYPLND